jgi:phage/conjugal plasmid C-4 type zinc finger TraR family protein
MDEVDHANNLAEMDLALRIREVRRAPADSESALECEICGNAIPEGRRKAMPGCKFCVACQRAMETGRF